MNFIKLTLSYDIIAIINYNILDYSMVALTKNGLNSCIYYINVLHFNFNTP